MTGNLTCAFCLLPYRPTSCIPCQFPRLSDFYPALFVCGFFRINKTGLLVASLLSYFMHTLSVSSTLRLISCASCLRVSKVVMTLSSSKIFPLASFRACSNDFSSCRRRKWNSPCNFSRSERFSSMSGRSALRT